MILHALIVTLQEFDILFLNQEHVTTRAYMHVPRGLFHVFEYSVEGTLLLGFDVVVINRFHKTNSRCIRC